MEEEPKCLKQFDLGAYQVFPAPLEARNPGGYQELSLDYELVTWFPAGLTGCVWQPRKV